MAKAPLKPEDFLDDAKALGVEVVDIMTVFNVESKGYGFDSQDFPKTLFEGQHFHRLTGGKYDSVAPDLSYPKWTTKYYGNEARERDRLARAVALDREAALQSASWGGPQIMGFNWKDAGCKSVQDFVTRMCKDSNEQLSLFTNLLLSWGLNDELRNHQWEAFARRYNGSGQVEYYAGRMKTEYDKLTRGK